MSITPECGSALKTSSVFQDKSRRAAFLRLWFWSSVNATLGNFYFRGRQVMLPFCDCLMTKVSSGRREVNGSERGRRRQRTQRGYRQYFRIFGLGDRLLSLATAELLDVWDCRRSGRELLDRGRNRGCYAFRGTAAAAADDNWRSWLWRWFRRRGSRWLGNRFYREVGVVVSVIVVLKLDDK